MIISKKMLGQKLRDMYDNAPYNEQVLMIHLFGIKFADVIRANGYNAREIIEAAGVKESYQTEVSKGMKIAKYIEIKKDMDSFDFE